MYPDIPGGARRRQLYLDQRNQKKSPERGVSRGAMGNALHTAG